MAKQRAQPSKIEGGDRQHRLKQVQLRALNGLTLGGIVGLPIALFSLGQKLFFTTLDLKNKIPLFGFTSINNVEMPWLELTLLAIGLWIFSPWIITFGLRSLGQVQTLSSGIFAQTRPEAYRSLQRFGQSNGLPIPTLLIIETDLPIVMSYGRSLPIQPKFLQALFAQLPVVIQQIFDPCRTIAISRSLVSQLSATELAALYSLEAAHLATGSAAVLSTVMLFQSLPYACYVGFSALSDRLSRYSVPLPPVIQTLNSFLLYPIQRMISKLLGIAASMAYLVFKVLRWGSYWLARSRTDYADDLACQTTDQPNELAKALLKLVQLTRNSLLHTQQLPMALEWLEPLLPVAIAESVSLRQIKSIGQNRPSRWAEINQHQVPMSVRLARLATLARDRDQRPLFDRPEQPWQWQLDPMHQQWFQPWIWGAIGFVLASVAWGIGWMGYWAGMGRLAWLGSDYNLFWGLPMIGFGLGQLMRFNSVLPDLPQTSPQTELPSLNAEGLKPAAVSLQGHLKGRSGFANWLGQDLWFVTESSDWVPVKINATTGPIGLILDRLFHQVSIDRAMTASSSSNRNASILLSGWLRQGITPWIDAEVLRFGNQSRWVSHHQTATVILGLVAIALGCVIVL